MLQHRDKPAVIKPVFAALKKLWEECDDDELQCAASNFVTSVGSHSADIMDGDDVDMMIEKYLTGKEPTLLGLC